MDSGSCRGERMYLYAHKFILIDVSLAVTLVSYHSCKMKNVFTCY